MPKLLLSSWHRWCVVVGLALLGLLETPQLVWAQQAISPLVRDQFLSDPEFTEPLDPLLPRLPVLRRLSPLEEAELRINLDALAAEAEDLFLAGQTDLAFQEWMREVRLRRILGYPEEIAAMQRVGLRAWEQSRSLEIQLLTLRLQQVQGELLAESPLNVRLLESVAKTFEVLRDVDSAIAVYDTLIVRAAQTGNQAERQRLLENLAVLQETWFRFDVAGKTYQSLLASLGAGRDPLKEVQYLQGAIRNYEGAGELEIAIDYQRQLIRKLQQTGQVQPVPTVTLAIARNYRALNNLSEARTAYTTAYSVALSQQQPDIASNALQDLAELYLAQGKTEEVLYLYNQRLEVERLSYNGYGLMEVFGNLAQLYESQNNPEAAISAYQEALILAQHLNYRVPYFSNRLQRLLIAQGRLTVEPAKTHQGDTVQPLINPNRWDTNQRRATN
jgi:tetratricopeptide (TPR) repeat protein